jgi:O-antigen ligase
MDESEEKKAPNLFETVAGIFFLFTAFILPYKQQAALLSVVLCCVIGLLGSRRGTVFKNIASSPLAYLSLGLYAVVLLSYTYSGASSNDKLKFILAYRELLLIPVLLCFLNGFHRLKNDAAIIFFGLTFAVIGLSIINFTRHFLELKPFFNVPANDNFIFHHHIIQNVMGSLAVLFMLVHARNNHVFSLKWFVYSTIALLGAVNILMMVQGRTGHMTLISCCFVFVLCAFNKQTKIAILIAVVAGLLVLVSTKNPFSHAVKRTLTEIQTYEKTGEGTSAGARIEFWKHAFLRIKEKPLQGYGAGSFRSEYAVHIQKNNLPQFQSGIYHPHNEFLLLWHDAGLLALLLFLGLITTLLWQAHKTANRDTKTMRYGITATLIIYAWVDVPMFNSIEALFFVLMIVCFFELNMKNSQQTV